MIAAWLVQVFLVGVLLAAAAHGLEECARLFRLPRRLVWFAALASTVVLTAVAPFREPAVPNAIALSAAGIVEDAAVAQTSGEAGGARVAHLAASAWSAPRRGVDMLLSGATRLGASDWGTRASAVFVVLWTTGSATLLLLFAATLARFGRARRGWPVREVAGARVRVTPSAGPAVVGVVRPEIVVPAWLLERDPVRQRLIIDHELEHVRAGDHALLAAGGILAALLPWHPAAWWMLARLRLCVELDCDARVLRRGATPAQYGGLLVDIAGQRAGLPFGAAALADSPTQLERRLMAMTSRRPRFARARGTALAAFASMLVLAACETELPSAPEIETMDVTDAERRMEAVGMMRAGEADVRFIVDGVDVSAADARALAPGDIARIEVRRGEDSAILVTTAERAAREAATQAAVGDASVARRFHVDGELVTSDAAGREVRLRQTADALVSDPEVQSREARDDGALQGNAGRTLRVASAADFDGILLVDGTRRQAADLRRLSPDAIESVEIIKGPAARLIFDEPAADTGIIRVTLKPGHTLR